MQLLIAVIGATGKLGSSILEEIPSDPRFQLDGAYTHPLSKQIKKPIRSDLENSNASIWIEVSLPSSLHRTLALAVQKKIPLVIGSTGIGPDLQKEIFSASKQIPILQSPNFSLGAVALFENAKKIVAPLKNADITIIETHRKEKKDAPSASALYLASQIESLGHAPIIHSIRAKDVVARLEMRVELEGETLILSHEIRNRRSFAKGALDACVFLTTKHAGLYSMQDMIYT